MPISATTISEVDDGLTILNVVGRPSVPQVKSGAQHQNNKFNFNAASKLFGAVGLLVALFFTLVQMSKGNASPANAATLTAMVPSKVFLTPTIVKEIGPIPTMVAAAPVVITVIAPTVEPSPIPPSETPQPTATFAGSFWLGVKSVWLSKLSTPPKTQSGLQWDAMPDVGAACPDSVPLGADIYTESGRHYVCIDRGVPACKQGVCNIIVFTQKSLPVSERANVRIMGQ